MQNPLFFRFNLPIAIGYAFLVLALVITYRRAASPAARLVVYLVSIVLVLAFLILFAPR